ncbi:hypothetical protein [Cupriavidus pampae]|uniref:Uncharacterized protein n=1 Tax=Cupriavidus pampae TaxID=659251 RepID=A0ABN7YWI8_9BURK|nr:hypothetical protein [Cupriavidus pampae]CAG9177623.1 hypothetical protein LMG32289_03859 [Cupriavidus pampae]
MNNMPDHLSRTLANNRAAAESASRVGKAPVPAGLPPPNEVVAAIDGVLGTGNFYGVAAQDAVARLVVVRDQFDAEMKKTNGA